MTSSAVSSILEWLEKPLSQFSPKLQYPDFTGLSTKMIKPIKIGGVVIPNNLVLAPMAGVTDGSFRLLCSSLGAGLSISELASAKAITMYSRQTIDLVRFQGQIRPYSVQLFGANPDTMAEAARIIEELQICDFIDINMGCPVPKVVKTGAGSALMKTPELASRIIRSVIDAVSIPVTIKCRIGWSETSINVKDFVKTVLDAGAKAITIHARTRQAGYSGIAQWQHLEGIKELCNDIPFFANGDIASTEHIDELYQHTGCDGFMIGRGCVGKPWLFSQLLGHDFTANKEIQWKIFRHHLIGMLMEHGPSAVPLFRIHLFGYIKNHPRASQLRRTLCNERSPSVVLETGYSFFNQLYQDLANDI